MSQVRLIEDKSLSKFRKNFNIEFLFIWESDEELEAICKFLRTAKDFEGLSGCCNWAEELADIISKND